MTNTTPSESLLCRLMNVRSIGFERLPRVDIQAIDDAIEVLSAAQEAAPAAQGEPAQQPQETIAYMTRNEEGDPAMLFFDLAEARLYCNPNEKPEPLVLSGRAQGEQSDTERNADRYLWLRERISVWRTNDGKGPVSWFPVTKVPASSRIQDETDAAIDQSIAAQQKGASNG